MSDESPQPEQVAGERQSPKLPPALEGMTIPLSTQISASSKEPGIRPSPMLATEWEGHRFQFVLRIHQYVNDYIRQADQKAAFVFAATGGILALLWKADLLKVHVQRASSDWGLLGWLSFLGAGATLIGGVCAFLVVRPRMGFKKHTGVIFWDSVSQFETAGDYISFVSAKKEYEVANEVLDHVYRLSRVCGDKYWWLGISMWTGGIGILASLAALMFQTTP